MPLPLPTLTRRLNEMAARPGFGANALQAELRRSHPQLLAQILADAERPDRFAAWGQSSNLENDATRELVQPRLLSALCTLARVAQPIGSAANAGLLHTYGYLLSNRRTPYGFKRQRWTQQVLETGLSLRPGLLSPIPPDGTLLGNVTALSDAVWNSRSGITYVEEPDGSSVRMLTRLLPFPPSNVRLAQAAALFYAWEDSERLHFVTLFPVEQVLMERLETHFRDSTALVKPRFNAVIPGLRSEGQPGRLSIQPADSNSRVAPIAMTRGQ